MTCEVIFGAAQSGKTEWANHRASELLQASNPLTVILPSQSLINDFRQRLLTRRDFTSTDRLRLGTFYSFVKSLAPIAGMTYQELDKSRLALVLEYFLEEHREKYPQLLSDELTSGFISTLLGYFSDLEDGNISTQIVREKLLYEDSALDGRIHQLHHLYIDFSEYVEKNGFMSRSQLFLEVTHWLKNQEQLPFSQHFLIDGFYDFNPVQQSIVETLVENAEYCGMTILHDSAKVFDYTKPTVEWITRLARQQHGTFQTLKPKTEPLPQIDRLFEKKTSTESVPENIRFVEAATMAVEVQETVRSVKKLLIGENVEPEEIAILYRSDDEYYPALLHKCRQENIPVQGTHEEPLARNSGITALMQWYEVQNNNFARDDVIRWVQSSYVDLKVDGHSLYADQFEYFSRQAQIVEGKSRWITRLNQYANRRDKPEFRQFADRLSRLWKHLPKAGTMSWEEHIAGLRNVMRLINIEENIQNSKHNGIPDEFYARDARALKTFQDLLDDFERLFLIFPLGKISTQQFASKLRELLRNTNYTTQNGHTKGVTLADVQTARGHYWKHVFLVGLTDEVFPIRSRVHPLVKLRDRIHINRILDGDGQVIEHRADLHEEQLLFYIALTRATETLQISTITGSEKILPSPFYETLLQFYSKDDGGEPEPLKIGAHTIEFRKERSWLQADLLQHLNRIEPLPDDQKPIHLRHFQHLQNVESLRNSAEFSRYDGQINSTEILKHINDDYHTDESFSPSRIEMYYLSPFQYFIKYILRLRELEEVTDELPPRDRGTLLHKIMEQFYKSLPPEFNGKATLENIESSLKYLDEVIDTIFTEFEEKGLPIPELLWRFESQKIRQYTRNAVEFFATNKPWSDLTIFPDEFEFKFGFPDDEFSKPPLILRRGEEEIRLRGQVDRLDADKNNGEFVVVDYKTTSGKQVKEFFNGRAIQLQIYALAAQHLFEKYSEPIRLSYYSFRKGTEDTKIDIKSRNRKGRDNPMDAADDLLWGALDNIRSGVFHPVEGECDKYCPVKHICRCDENRIRRKRVVEV